MITFYPTLSRDQVCQYTTSPRVLLPASSWASEEVRKYGHVRRSLLVPHLTASVIDRAADCGGFVATLKWGDYRYSVEQYVEWLSAWSPRWAAMMDYCCENAITSGRLGVVRERQQKTTGMAYRMWDDYHDASWVWTPTIQGWLVEDYSRHAAQMRPLIAHMQAQYRQLGKEKTFRVGIGTLCRWANVQMIHEVVRTVTQVLPGIPLHLWGTKSGALQSPLAFPESVVSVDSAAWNGMFASGNEAWRKSGGPRRRYLFEVMLPRYEQKIEEALSQPKQMRMLFPDAMALAEPKMEGGAA